MAYTNYVKLRILHHHFRGLKAYTTAKALKSEGIKVSRFGVIMMYTETGLITRRPGSGRLSKVTSCVKFVEQMDRDDETAAFQLHGCGSYITRVDISWQSVLPAHQAGNKAKRLEWCERYKDNFDDVIWSDESTIQLEAQAVLLPQERTSTQAKAAVRALN